MKLTDIQPFVRQALIGSLNKSNTNDVYQRIKTVDCRLFYIVSSSAAGRNRMTVEKVRYPLYPGCVIMFPAGTEYIWEIDEVKYYAINFDYTFDHCGIKKTFHPIHSALFSEDQIIERPNFEDEALLNSPIVTQSTPAISELIRQLTMEYCMSGEHTDQLLSALMKAILLNVVRRRHTRENCTKRASMLQIQSVVEYINCNYDQSITGESIAELFHFHVRYLNRVFKEHTGSTIHDFIMSRRLSAAMEILRSQNIPIGEVASKCGFSSIHHFCKTFRKFTDMSPTEYRNCGS